MASKEPVAAHLEREDQEAFPKDATLRTRLLLHYSLEAPRLKESEKKRSRFLRWMIEVCPEAPVLHQLAVVQNLSEPNEYEPLARLWKEHLKTQPNNPQLLTNAGAFRLFAEPSAALGLLERAAHARPEHFETLRLLGIAYQNIRHREATEAARRATADRELVIYERALPLAEEQEQRMYMLLDAMEAALESTQPQRVKRYAAEVLEHRVEPEVSHGDAIHRAHVFLGRLALMEGRVEAARDHLLSAAQISGSPSLSSFGPNMSLARDLLRAGERDAVLEFLERCKRFWHPPRLDDWIDAIKRGEEPDFGAHLTY